MGQEDVIMLNIAIALFILCGVQTAGVLIYMFRVSRMEPTIGGDESQPDREEMKKYIVWKSFYVNPDDPRGWVPKTSGVGMTVNFRTKSRALTFAAMVAGSLIAGLAGAAVVLSQVNAQ